jgi:hypothetical protein
VFLKLRHEAVKSGKSAGEVSAVLAIGGLFLAGTGWGGFWIIRKMETEYLASIPRAHLEVEDVTVDIENKRAALVEPMGACSRSQHIVAHGNIQEPNDQSGNRNSKASGRRQRGRSDV